MSDWRKNYLLLIIARISAQCPQIPLVVRDLGQLETHESPAIDGKGTVLISFENWNPENMGKNNQILTGDVVVKFARAIYTQASNITPSQYRGASLDAYDFDGALHTALHGWAADDWFGPLTRISLTDDTRRTGLAVTISRYRLSFEDYSAQRNTHKTSVTGKVGISYQHPSPDGPVPGTAHVSVITAQGSRTTTSTVYEQHAPGNLVFQLPAKKILTYMVLLPDADGVISIGTTDGGEELLPATQVTNGVAQIITLNQYFKNAAAIYISADMAADYKIYYL